MLNSFVMMSGIAAVAATWTGNDLCRNPVKTGDFYYCPESDMYCHQCSYHKYFKGPCSTNKDNSDCRPCPGGTWIDKPYHMDTNCSKIPESVAVYIDMRVANILETDIDVPQIMQSFDVKDDRQIKKTAENMDKSSGASAKHVVYLINYLFLFIIITIYKNYY